MSSLDDVRELADHDPVMDSDVGFVCQFCEGAAHLLEGGSWQIIHIPHCPWLVLPRIIAALEAADLVLWGVDRDSATMHVALADLRKAMQG